MLPPMKGMLLGKVKLSPPEVKLIAWVFLNTGSSTTAFSIFICEA